MIGAVGDPAARRAVVDFASTRPVFGDYGDGGYCLDMATANLGVLNSGQAPVLLDHLRSVEYLVGIVERAWVEGEIASAIVRFGPTARCTEVYELVRAGILVNASVGLRMELSDDADADGVRRPRYWCPYEISLVTIPADYSARVRSVPPPPHVLETFAEAAAARAAGAPATWRAWMDALEPRILAAAEPAAAAALVRAELERELARHAEEARARFLRPGG